MTARSEQLHEDRPPSARVVALSALLGFLAIASFTVAATVLWALVFVVKEFNWRNSGGALVLLAALVLIGGGAFWKGIKLVRPGGMEPISPSSRRTNQLFFWGGVIAIPGALALVFGSNSKDNPFADAPFAVFSNSPVARGVALFVIVSWLVSIAVSWWWYFSSDEHERRAYDFGSLVACGVFICITPLWWIAARAGMLPQPDAMLLWVIASVIVMGGWFWRRFR